VQSLAKIALSTLTWVKKIYNTWAKRPSAAKLARLSVIDQLLLYATDLPFQ